MLLLQIAGYGALGMAGLGIMIALGMQAWLLIGASASLFAVGSLILAADRVITLLAQIRDAVVPSKAIVVEADQADRPVRSLADIEADLVRLKRI